MPNNFPLSSIASWRWLQTNAILGKLLLWIGIFWAIFSINPLRFVEISVLLWSCHQFVSRLFVEHWTANDIARSKHELCISVFKPTTERKTREREKATVAKINLLVDFSSFNFQLNPLFSHFSSVHSRVLFCHLSVVSSIFYLFARQLKIYFGHFCKWFIWLCDSPSLNTFQSRLRWQTSAPNSIYHFESNAFRKSN